MRNHEKNNAWNIRHLVDDSFDPSSQQASVLYSRLMDFKPEPRRISIEERVLEGLHDISLHLSCSRLLQFN